MASAAVAATKNDEDNSTVHVGRGRACVTELEGLRGVLLKCPCRRPVLHLKGFGDGSVPLIPVAYDTKLTDRETDRILMQLWRLQNIIPLGCSCSIGVPVILDRSRNDNCFCPDKRR